MGFTVLNDRGRIAALAIIQSLGWQPGTRVAVRERAGLVVVTHDPIGGTTVTPHGHLRLPTPIRRWCGLEAGSRVLLVADPAQQRLVVCPSGALQAVLARHYADAFGGDPRER